MRTQLHQSTKFQLNKLNFFAIPLMAFAGLGALGIAAINQDVDPNASATNTSTLTGTFSYGDEYITISNNSVIDLGSTELSASSAYVYATDNVTVSTNSPTGYDLYLSSGNSDSAALTTPGSYTEIAATSGTGGSGGTPAALDADSYGYAIASATIGNTSFDTDYSSPTSTSKFAAVPAGTSDRIRSTSSAVTDGETTAVHYGANVTNYLAPGQYTGQVTYSAVVTPTDNAITATISPNSGAWSDTLTITSGPKDTISTTHPLDTSEVEIIFSQNGVAKDSCNISKTDISNGYLVTTCTTPNLTAGAYDVEIIVPRYGFKDKITKGYTAKVPTLKHVVNGLNITTMQEFTSSVCPMASTWSSADNDASLLDTRDNNSYIIRKLADGHCWMVQDLRLVNKTLSTTDSDISDSFTIPASSTNTGTTDGTWGTDANANGIDHTAAYYDDSTTYGAYYNWYTATAGSGTYSTAYGNVDYSICPKGWKLPLGDTVDYSWYYLYNTGYNANVSKFQTATLTGSGYYTGTYTGGSSSSFSNTGSHGYWWSRRAYSDRYAYVLHSAQNTIEPQNGNYIRKYHGYTVRCVFVGE